MLSIREKNKILPLSKGKTLRLMSAKPAFMAWFWGRGCVLFLYFKLDGLEKLLLISFCGRSANNIIMAVFSNIALDRYSIAGILKVKYDYNAVCRLKHYSYKQICVIKGMKG